MNTRKRKPDRNATVVRSVSGSVVLIKLIYVEERGVARVPPTRRFGLKCSKVVRVCVWVLFWGFRCPNFRIIQNSYLLCEVQRYPTYKHWASRLTLKLNIEHNPHTVDESSKGLLHWQDDCSTIYIFFHPTFVNYSQQQHNRPNRRPPTQKASRTQQFASFRSVIIERGCLGENHTLNGPFVFLDQLRKQTSTSTSSYSTTKRYLQARSTLFWRSRLLLYIGSVQQMHCK